MVAAERNTHELLGANSGGSISCGTYAGVSPISVIGLCVTAISTSIRGNGLYQGIDTTPQ